MSPRYNPHLFTPKSKRWNVQNFAGGKIYFAVLLPHGIRAHRIFKRASEAEAYAVRLKERWCRLYDALIVEMIAPSQPRREPAAEGEA